MKNMKVKLLVLFISLAILSGSCGNKKPGESTKVSETLTAVPVVDSKMMIVAKLSVKPEKAKDFIEAAREMIEKSNKESGCSFYKLYQDPYDNSKFVFVEEYKNQAAVDAHFATDYFKAFGPKIGDLIIGPPEIKIVSVAKEVIQ
jgi:quinol monooxygenase YgiN